MGVFRYTAIDLRPDSSGTTHRGERPGQSAAEVRASLRRIGLQVTEIAPVRQGLLSRLSAERLLQPSVSLVQRYLRNRRRPQRCELYDSLSTMLESGMPLLEAMQTVSGNVPARSSRFVSPRQTMLVQVRERLRTGSSLDEAMLAHPAWFDGIEIAMVRAGQHAGELSRVLRSLAQQHERSGELGQKLVAALAYPAIITVVGLGVVLFLSVKTLPDLTQILVDSGIEIPVLTQRVMGFGQFIAANWLLMILLGALAGTAALVAPAALERAGIRRPQRLQLPTPRVLRRMAVGGLSLRLTDLIRTGVPIVDALRVLAPTVANRHLRVQLHKAADGVERGDELSSSLNSPCWFDDEYRRLLDIGQAAGQLDIVLERLGLRYQRQARRLIDRLAALLEPCVMLILAVLVGVVVMAAVLPLIRLQEVL